MFFAHFRPLRISSAVPLHALFAVPVVLARLAPPPSLPVEPPDRRVDPRTLQDAQRGQETRQVRDKRGRGRGGGPLMPNQQHTLNKLPTEAEIVLISTD